jgi:hypothetical protein
VGYRLPRNDTSDGAEDDELAVPRECITSTPARTHDHRNRRSPSPTSPRPTPEHLFLTPKAYRGGSPGQPDFPIADHRDHPT